MAQILSKIALKIGWSRKTPNSNTYQLICRVQIFRLNLSVSQLPRALTKYRNFTRPCRYNGGLLKICFCHSIVYVYIVYVYIVALNLRARAQERGRKIQMLNLELAEVKDTLQVGISERANGSLRSFHYCRHFRDANFNFVREIQLFLWF